SHTESATSAPEATDASAVSNAQVTPVGNESTAEQEHVEQAATQPIATAQAPTAAYLQKHDHQVLAAKDVDHGVARLRGPQARVVTNMEASLDVPTATSVRTIPAKLLTDNRVVINNHLARTRGGKVSFTHLIGYAIIEALKEQ